MKSARLKISVLALLTASLVGGIACSGESNDVVQSGSGGSSGGSGRTSSGGTTEVGGSSASTGGASNSGSSTGGNQAAGGLSTSSGGAVGNGGATQGGATTALGGSTPIAGGAVATGGKAAGGQATGGSVAAGGKAAGGQATGGGVAAGGKAAGGQATGGGVAAGGTQAAGGVVATGGKAAGGQATGGAVAAGGKATGGVAGASTYPVSTGTPTVYLAGDSTVQTYSTNANDQQGWGQRLQEFFTSTSAVLVVNKSIGGRSSKSFIDEGRLAEIVAVIKQGDYLLAQWGINDRYTSDAARYTDPATTFRTYLKQYITGARSKNAIPVLVTPTPRHQYANGVFENGFPAYCEAIKAVGAETNTPVIDLQTKGLAYYTSVGEAFVSSTIILDALHFKSAGAYQMARLVAQGIGEINVPISQFVVQSKL